MSGASALDPNDTFFLNENESCAYNVTMMEPVVDDFSLVYKIIIGIAWSALGIIGLTGNVSILVVLFKDKGFKLANTSNVLLANLAIVDLFYFTTSHPLTMWNALREGTWRAGDVSCQVSATVNTLVYLVAAYSLALISLEKQLNLAYPAREKSFTTKTALISLAFLWTFAFVCAILPFFGLNSYAAYRNPIVCGPNLDFSTWQVIVMTAGLMGSAAIIFYAHIRMLITVLQYKRRARQRQIDAIEIQERYTAAASSAAGRAPIPTEYSNKSPINSPINSPKPMIAGRKSVRPGTAAFQWHSFKENVRTAFTVFLVVITYIVAFLFGAAMGTFLSVIYKIELKSCRYLKDVNMIVWTIVIMLYAFNFAANPYIYGLRNNDVNKEFKATLKLLTSLLPKVGQKKRNGDRPKRNETTVRV
ncbi:melatonin receptor type 1C-like [Oscarella lobularis]|uniref:melatonin receptor type 1C-like n=1 Tax=Oscarella lobularis TaxID=121494 RepID=UPI003313B8F6